MRTETTQKILKQTPEGLKEKVRTETNNYMNSDALIVEYMGMKLGYYKTYKDTSTGDDLNYSWQLFNIPLIYSEGDIFKSYTEKSHHNMWKYKEYVLSPLPIEEYNFKYKISWDALIPVYLKVIHTYTKGDVFEAIKTGELSVLYDAIIEDIREYNKYRDE